MSKIVFKCTTFVFKPELGQNQCHVYAAQLHHCFGKKYVMSICNTVALITLIRGRGLYVLRFALRTKLNPFRAVPIDWDRFREKKEEKEAKHFFACSTF